MDLFKWKFVWRVIGILNFRKILSFLHNRKPDLILIEHTGGFITLLTFLLYRKNSKRKDKMSRMVLKYDLDPNIVAGILFRLEYKLVLAIFDIVIVESKCAYDVLWSIKKSSKINIVPNGYLPHEIVTGYGDRKKIILSVGRVVKQKGHDILIKSFAKVHDFHLDWFLVIAGPIEDKQYYADLRDTIEKLGITKYVEFSGSLSDAELEQKYKQASIFCLLSRFEGFGIAIVEAISYGLPAIISAAGCGKEYRKYGTFVVPIGDIDKAAEAMLKLMENAALRKEISKKQMGGILSWNEVALNIEKLAFSI